MEVCSGMYELVLILKNLLLYENFHEDSNPKALFKFSRDYIALIITFQAPSVLMIAISMFFASAIFPHEYSTEVLLYMLFWGAMIASTFSIIMHYGKEFVDFPKLREDFRNK